MAKAIFISALMIMQFYCSSAQVKPGTDEPVLKLDVYVDGNRYSIMDGDTLIIEEKPVVIRTSDYKNFNSGILNFDYPKNFSWQFEENVNLRSWTLQGNDFTIMYFDFDIEVDPEAFINQMIKNFGKRNCNISQSQLMLGEELLEGKKINVTLLESKMTYDIYRLISNDDHTHLVAFQDMKNEDGSNSEEAERTMQVIRETFHKTSSTTDFP